ncbi:MAG TPA: twin-arginine translocase TatA/TatE family subunit [Terriglobia bacterium]|nr:twin-arginine translocase TatA/TatE family subunit [Terriglobia bacterium]
MFGSGLEIGFLLFIAFLLFGPKKLPEIARTLGKGMAELRRASNELKGSLEEELRNIERQTEVSTESHDVPSAAHGELTTGAVPKYGDYHSEPTPDEPASRS